MLSRSNNPSIQSITFKLIRILYPIPIPPLIEQIGPAAVRARSKLESGATTAAQAAAERVRVEARVSARLRTFGLLERRQRATTAGMTDASLLPLPQVECKGDSSTVGTRVARPSIPLIPVGTCIYKQGQQPSDGMLGSPALEIRPNPSNLSDSRRARIISLIFFWLKLGAPCIDFFGARLGRRRQGWDAVSDWNRCVVTLLRGWWDRPGLLNRPRLLGQCRRIGVWKDLHGVRC